MTEKTGTTANPIKFNSGGKLKIMHITDTHLEQDNIDMSVWLMGEACSREKPDIVIITGDNVQNEEDAEVTKGYINKLMKVFEERSIPVAVTFGNHDSEVGAMSRGELMAYYNTFSCSVTHHKEGADACISTFNVPVLSSTDNDIKFNLWVFDSNDYDGEGHYGCVLDDGVQWYNTTSATLTAQNNGEKIYSLAFQHIIVPEVYDALKKVNKRKLYSFSHMYNKNDFYMFDPSAKNFGTLNETPCCGYQNYGQFEAMAKNGDVLAIFSGHDHTNAFGVRHKGIDISNSLSTRYNNDRFSSQYGYRIIEVNEGNTAAYTSYNVHWYNMFKHKYLTEIKASGDAFAYKTACAVTYKGLMQKFLTKTGRLFSTIATGRRVTYND